MTSQAEANAHRADLAALAGLALIDLRVLFDQFDTAAEVRDGLLDVLPQLVALYGAAAAALAADWYDELRVIAEARGTFRAIAADLPEIGRIESLARWSVSPMFSESPDPVTAFTKASGGLQQLIANADRNTITGSSVRDRAARGWARSGTGRCDLCRQIISRGGVFTEATSQFETHDHCGCIGVPIFLGQSPLT